MSDSAIIVAIIGFSTGVILAAIKHFTRRK